MENDKSIDELKEQIKNEKEKTLNQQDNEEVYDQDSRDQMVEDDEIDPMEEGFMEGYEGRGNLSKCEECSQPLDEDDDIIERKFKDELIWFCSEDCAEKYMQDLKEE